MRVLRIKGFSDYEGKFQRDFSCGPQHTIEDCRLIMLAIKTLMEDFGGEPCFIQRISFVTIPNVTKLEL